MAQIEASAQEIGQSKCPQDDIAAEKMPLMGTLVSMVPQEGCSPEDVFSENGQGSQDVHQIQDNVQDIQQMQPCHAADDEQNKNVHEIIKRLDNVERICLRTQSRVDTAMDYVAKIWNRLEEQRSHKSESISSNMSHVQRNADVLLFPSPSSMDAESSEDRRLDNLPASHHLALTSPSSSTSATSTTCDHTSAPSCSTDYGEIPEERKAQSELIDHYHDVTYQENLETEIQRAIHATYISPQIHAEADDSSHVTICPVLGLDAGMSQSFMLPLESNEPVVFWEKSKNSIDEIAQSETNTISESLSKDGTVLTWEKAPPPSPADDSSKNSTCSSSSSDSRYFYGLERRHSSEHLEEDANYPQHEESSLPPKHEDDSDALKEVVTCLDSSKATSQEHQTGIPSYMIHEICSGLKALHLDACTAQTDNHLNAKAFGNSEEIISLLSDICASLRDPATFDAVFMPQVVEVLDTSVVLPSSHVHNDIVEGPGILNAEVLPQVMGVLETSIISHVHDGSNLQESANLDAQAMSQIMEASEMSAATLPSHNGISSNLEDLAAGSIPQIERVLETLSMVPLSHANLEGPMIDAGFVPQIVEVVESSAVAPSSHIHEDDVAENVAVPAVLDAGFIPQIVEVLQTSVVIPSFQAHHDIVEGPADLNAEVLPQILGVFETSIMAHVPDDSFGSNLKGSDARSMLQIMETSEKSPAAGPTHYDIPSSLEDPTIVESMQIVGVMETLSVAPSSHAKLEAPIIDAGLVPQIVGVPESSYNDRIAETVENSAGFVPYIVGAFEPSTVAPSPNVHDSHHDTDDMKFAPAMHDDMSDYCIVESPLDGYIADTDECNDLSIHKRASSSMPEHPQDTAAKFPIHDMISLKENEIPDILQEVIMKLEASGSPLLGGIALTTKDPSSYASTSMNLSMPISIIEEIKKTIMSGQLDEIVDEPTGLIFTEYKEEIIMPSTDTVLPYHIEETIICQSDARLPCSALESLEDTLNLGMKFISDAFHDGTNDIGDKAMEDTTRVQGSEIDANGISKDEVHGGYNFHAIEADDSLQKSSDASDSDISPRNMGISQTSQIQNLNPIQWHEAIHDKIIHLDDNPLNPNYVEKRDGKLLEERDDLSDGQDVLHKHPKCDLEPDFQLEGHSKEEEDAKFEPNVTVEDVFKQEASTILEVDKDNVPIEHQHEKMYNPEAESCHKTEQEGTTLVIIEDVFEQMKSNILELNQEALHQQATLKDQEDEETYTIHDVNKQNDKYNKGTGISDLLDQKGDICNERIEDKPEDILDPLKPMRQQASNEEVSSRFSSKHLTVGGQNNGKIEPTSVKDEIMSLHMHQNSNELDETYNVEGAARTQLDDIHDGTPADEENYLDEESSLAEYEDTSSCSSGSLLDLEEACAALDVYNNKASQKMILLYNPEKHSWTPTLPKNLIPAVSDSPEPEHSDEAMIAEDQDLSTSSLRDNHVLDSTITQVQLENHDEKENLVTNTMQNSPEQEGNNRSFDEPLPERHVLPASKPIQRIEGKKETDSSNMKAAFGFEDFSFYDVEQDLIYEEETFAYPMKSDVTLSVFEESDDSLSLVSMLPVLCQDAAIQPSFLYENWGAETIFFSEDSPLKMSTKDKSLISDMTLVGDYLLQDGKGCLLSESLQSEQWENVSDWACEPRSAKRASSQARVCLGHDSSQEAYSQMFQGSDCLTLQTAVSQDPSTFCRSAGTELKSVCPPDNTSTLHKDSSMHQRMLDMDATSKDLVLSNKEDSKEEKGENLQQLSIYFTPEEEALWFMITGAFLHAQAPLMHKNSKTEPRYLLLSLPPPLEVTSELFELAESACSLQDQNNICPSGWKIGLDLLPLEASAQQPCIPFTDQKTRGNILRFLFRKVWSKLSLCCTLQDICED